MATVTRLDCSKWDGSKTHRCKLEVDHEGSCVLTPRKPIAAAVATCACGTPIVEPVLLTDEAIQARCSALATALRDVLRLCVDRKAHAFADAQEALNVADALLVEMEGNRG